MSSVPSPKDSSTGTIASNGAHTENGSHSNESNGVEKNGTVQNGTVTNGTVTNGTDVNGVQTAFPFAPKPLTPPETIVKRDGRVMPFEPSRIEDAIRKCFANLGVEAETPIETITERIVNVVSVRHTEPTVEQVQDIVETVLQAAGEYDAAKSYILYRAEHARMRTTRPVPEVVRSAFEQSSEYFPTQLQKFQFYDKYSRFNYDLGRRETWIETVDRAVDFLGELSDNRLSQGTYSDLRSGILTMKASPSMRLLAMAGPAARRNNIAIYNCSYMPVDSADSFVEALIISMSGCGVGYSVESQYIEKFPRVQRQTGGALLKYIVPDSSEGWADAVRVGINTWFEGGDVHFDYSEVRPAGAPLYTKGGRASGPEPLRQMLEFARGRILSRQGSFLRSLDAHDIMCAVGNAAVSGGVRRTAMIALFDMDNAEMRFSKSGDNIVGNEQRWNANNSAVWPDRHLSQAEIARYLLDMVESGRGEPGIFSRGAANRTRPERRTEADFGTNPCGEISLRPMEFCNLSIAIARPDDTYETLAEKVKLATTIGTIQSMATHFPGLRPQWKENCSDERLLGVDINGQLDSPAAQDADVQRRLKQIAIETNRSVAEQLGINQSASITCVKPSGNSSQLFDCSPGIHTRWSPYYVRNVRVGTHTPLFKVLRDAGVPMDPENGQMPETANTWVIHFPVKAPEDAITRNDRSAIEQCKYWLQCKTEWTEHNPSVTITYQPDEVIDIVKWVWENQDKIGGMTFLPAFDAQYDQMPYEEITQEKYEKLLEGFPQIDFSKVYRYEEEDLTTAAQELACFAGTCEIM